jgi:hypothetical protein
MHPTETYTIRPATDGDAWALRWLAALDSQRQLAGPALIGEIDGIPAAAISLNDRRVAADPFQTTFALRELLRARASASGRIRTRALHGSRGWPARWSPGRAKPDARRANQQDTPQPKEIQMLAKVTARMKMNCQGDPARIETFRVAVPVESGKVAGSGRFSYRFSTSPTSGFSLSGRFVTRTKASGTFARSDSGTGCYVGRVKWSASLV